MNACELMIKPRNKKQQKELDGYIKQLDLKSEGEIFILNCVLYMDWSRQKIIQSINKIRERPTDGLICFHIVIKAPYITVDYSISSPYGDVSGWAGDYANSLEKRMFYIYHRMDYYTS